MPASKQTRTLDQNPPDGGLSSPTAAVIGTTAGAATASASTSGAAARMTRKPRNTKRAAPSVEQALGLAQDIVRLAHDAGMHSFIVNTRDGAAIVLVNTHYCPKCHNLSQGTSCTRCGGQNG